MYYAEGSGFLWNGQEMELTMMLYGNRMSLLPIAIRVEKKVSGKWITFDPTFHSVSCVLIRSLDSSSRYHADQMTYLGPYCTIGEY